MEHKNKQQQQQKTHRLTETKEQNKKFAVAVISQKTEQVKTNDYTWPRKKMINILHFPCLQISEMIFVNTMKHRKPH